MLPLRARRCEAQRGVGHGVSSTKGGTATWLCPREVSFLLFSSFLSLSWSGFWSL